MNSQTLGLKWADHKSNMTSELQELYSSDTLFDVTIACGEYNLKAHKVVLSAASTFFRKLFLDNPCTHPVLIMTDVDFGDLKTIVEFIYQGEIHVSQEKLTRFLKIAERLKIKGLSSIEDMNLNSNEQSTIEVDSHYSSGAWEHTAAHPHSQDASQLENAACSSTKNLGESIKTDRNQKASEFKLEHESTHTDSNNCMYWQDECFENASSTNTISGLSNPSQPTPSGPCHLSTSSVLPQIPALVSHQESTLSFSHQLSKPSTSHQLYNSSVSHQPSNLSVSHEHRVPLNSEKSTYLENQAENETKSHIQEKQLVRDNIPETLSQSQDDATIIVPDVPVASTELSFDALESSNNHSCQGDEPERADLRGRRKCRNNYGDLNYTKHRTTYVKCNFCKKSFVRHDSLERHMQLHSTLKEFTCPMCNYRFADKTKLTLHLRTHTGVKPFVCRICYKRFAQSNNLKSHERTHTGEKPFGCPYCHKRFIQSSNLKKHILTHT